MDLARKPENAYISEHVNLSDMLIAGVFFRNRFNSEHAFSKTNRDVISLQELHLKQGVMKISVLSLKIKEIPTFLISHNTRHIE